MSITLTINGTSQTFPADKPLSVQLAYAPDPQKPSPVADLSTAIAAAKPGDTIYVGGSYKFVKSITVKTPGLTILPVSPTHIEFDPQGAKDAALFVLDKTKGFAVTDITVSGPAKSSAASYVVRCENAEDVFIERVKTVATPDGGMGIVFCRGVTRLDVFGCSTEKTTVYSMYCSAPGGQLINQNITVRRCVWGPSESHNMRVYGVKSLLIDECFMDNLKSASGRQCLKLMSGENVTVKRTEFRGSLRAGRDVNDPQSNTLKNVLFESCTINDWARTDPGADVRYKDCEISVDNSGFCFHLFDKTSFDGVKATYTGTGGRFSNSSKHIAAIKNSTFNGKPV